MQKEIWKYVPNYEKFYQASNLGRVKSCSRVVKELPSLRYPNGRERKTKEKILKPMDNGLGYLQVTLSMNNKQKTLYVHRLVAICFLHNPLGLRAVNHISGLKTENNVTNLEWCTYSDNMHHAFSTELNKNKGTNHINSKLTEDDVVSILLLLKSKKYKQYEISDMFNVSNTTITNIKQKRIWKHIHKGE